MTEEPKEAALKEPMGGPMPADAKENSGPTGEQLLDKYVQAAGGAAAIDKVSSRVMKGTIDFGGKSLPIDIYSKDPEKRISFTHMPEGDSVTAFNGHEGWLGTPGRPLREMHGSDLDGASIDADLHLAMHLKTMFSELRVRGTEQVGEHEAYIVVVKIPYRWTLARPSGRFTIQVTEVKQNIPVDEAKFAKPAAEQNGPAK